MVLIIFGLPATGKTFVANIIAKQHGCFFYDGDTDMPKDLLDTIANREPVTDAQRDVFFNKLITNITVLAKTHKNLVVAQTFIKEKYRKQLLAKIPDAKFILVATDTAVREERLVKRRTYQLDPEYAKKMCELFEAPTIPYVSVINTTDGEKEVGEQVANVLDNLSLEKKRN